MKQDNETKQFMAAFGEAVKRHRIEKGLTQEQLAVLIGSESENDQRSLVSKIEKGLRNPDVFKVAKIANALDMTPTALINEAMQIQDETEACELFKKCYGLDAFQLVKYFLQLNSKGQQELLKYANYCTSREDFIEDKKGSSKKQIS